MCLFGVFFPLFAALEVSALADTQMVVTFVGLLWKKKVSGQLKGSVLENFLYLVFRWDE